MSQSTTPTAPSTLSFQVDTIATAVLNNVAGNKSQGNFSVGDNNVNVSSTTTRAAHGRMAPAAHSNPQFSASSPRSLSCSTVQINKYSKIEWPMHEAKAAAKYSLLGLIVGGVIGFLISGFNPVIAAIGAWAGSNAGAAYGLCRTVNPSLIRQMAVQAVAEHIRNPADFRLMDGEQEDGHEAAFLHCREAIESVAKDWVSRQKSDGQEPTRAEVREYIHTCAKQLAEGLNWNQLATRGKRDRAIVDLLKHRASLPQSLVADIRVADHLRDLIKPSRFHSQLGDVHGAPRAMPPLRSATR